MSVLFGRISAHTSLLSLKISGYSLRPMPRLNENPLRKNCKAHFGEQCLDDFGRGGRRLADASQGRQVQKGRTEPPKCDTCSTPVGLTFNKQQHPVPQAPGVALSSIIIAGREHSTAKCSSSERVTKLPPICSIILAQVRRPILVLSTRSMDLAM